MKEDNQGNPKAVEDNVFGSDGDNFFENLEAQVNGAVQEDTQNVQNEATPAQQDPIKVEQKAKQVSQPSEIDTIKKRYSDSSREAQRLKAQLNELQPYMPVLDAMKKDRGLVSHVREYFEEGGSVPKDIKSKLKLPEDFAFDADDMVNNEDSDSRKVFASMVDSIVTQRTGEMQQEAASQNQAIAYQNYVSSQAQDFINKHGLTESEFQSFITEAQDRFQTKGMTFDDMYLIMNRGAVNQNVANATKNDMLNQMKNVRDIPTSQSAANSKAQSTNPNDGIFDALKNIDGGLDDMFG